MTRLPTLEGYVELVWANLAVIIVTTLAGLLALTRIPVAQLPDIVPPQVEVTATYPGAEAMGARPVIDGAASVQWAATLPDDGPRGGFFRDGQPLGW